MDKIKITGAYEGNLRNISLEIPKHKLVVFTGLSGSGKSTLLIDVLFNECQRQYLEAMSLQGIHKPRVERIQGASPAIVIQQTYINKNPRSTIGTMTDVYTDLRMIYEKLGVRTCPYCGADISAADCKEETEKRGEDFHVYMYCGKCGRRMDKITRTFFSFNTKEGACPTCDGLGRVHTVLKENVVDESLSLEEGAVRYWEKNYGAYQVSVLYEAFRHYGLSAVNGMAVREFSEIQKEILYNGVESAKVRLPKTAEPGRFEGVLPILWRRLADKNGEMKQLAAYFDVVECPDCRGERLGGLSRGVMVHGTRLPQLAHVSFEQLLQWIQELRFSLPKQHESFVNAYFLDIETKLNRFIYVGLGYLSLDRQIVTLSGGELQRLRLAAALDSDLSGVIYILDEPTAGLHPRDTAGLMTILKRLRDLGNTVLVIEHDADVMAQADYIIDMGPGSGQYGGEVIAAGTLEEIKNQKESVTGNYLLTPHPAKMEFRKADDTIRIKNARKFNLKNITVGIPTGCLTTVTGPSGSGKSTLVFEVLAEHSGEDGSNHVSGLEQFDRIIETRQSAITKMKRSNVATYCEAYTHIRSVFAKTEAAGRAGLTSAHFSFNTPGGRCENCKGMGYVDSNMLFFADTEITCPVCNGNRFNGNVLAVRHQSLTIKDVLELSVREAAGFFADYPKIIRILNLLGDVGLGYLQLGQSLTTLSGGEGQRLKLAKELIGSNPNQRSLYLLDEPTIGLHPIDVEHFLVLLNRMVDAGNTVVVVEHNQQIIKNSDWVIDLGPEGGEKGGNVLFTGTPKEMEQYVL